MKNLSLILVGILTALVLTSGCIEETAKSPEGNITGNKNFTAGAVENTQLFQDSEILIDLDGDTALKPKIKDAVLNSINPSRGLIYDNINISANRKPGGDEEYEVKATCISSNAPFTDKYLFLYIPSNDEIILKSYVLMAISERDKISAVNTALNDEEIKQKLRNYKIYSEPTVKRILSKDSEKYGGVGKTLFSVTWAAQDRMVIVISALVDSENDAIVNRWYSEGNNQI